MIHVRSEDGASYRFGVFELDTRSGDLRKSGIKIKVQDQPYQVLLKLLERPGDVVTRGQLRSALWPADTFVDFDTGLNTAVKRLREVLGDPADTPIFIETVPRRGYRFIAPVSRNGAHLGQAKSEKPVEPKVSWLRIGMFIFALLCAAAVGALAVLRLSPLPPPRILASTQITSDGIAKGNLQTDGKNLFFNERFADHYALLQVPAAGGPISTLVASMPGTFIVDVSADGSKLLLINSDKKSSSLAVMDLTSTSIKNLPGIEPSDAAWAPDGKLVFTKDSDIYTANADGTHPRRLLTVSGSPFSVRYSPDGSRIRFTISDKFIWAYSLWEARADGSGLHEVLTGWNTPPLECCGVWTPDGRYYLFASQRQGSSRIWVVEDSLPFWRKRSPAPVPLTTGPMNFSVPQFSRDGKKLFVLAAEPRAELVRYDARSNTFVPFLSGISAGDVEASRDGQALVYVKYPESTLWRSKPDGREPVQLTNPSLQVSLPHWSPNGQRIAFSASQPGHPWNVFLISSTGGPVEQITSGPIADLDPSWSPDGRTLAFGQLRYWGNSQRYSIQMLNLATRQQTQLADSDAICCPRWSPDGRYLAAATEKNDELRLYEFVSQKWTTIAKDIGLIGYIVWSRDSKYVNFDTIEAKQPFFYKFRVADSHLEPIVSLSSTPRFWGHWGPWAGLASDGSPLLVRDISNQEIYAFEWLLP